MPATDGDTLEQAVAILSDAAVGFAGRVEGLEGATLPVTLTTGLIEALHRCEGQAVASAGAAEREPDWPQLRGAALDSYVAHVLFEGPVADPVEDLVSMWEASGRDDRVGVLTTMLEDPVEAPHRCSELDLLARSALDFSAVASLSPRVEVKMGTTVAGSVALRGRVDVMLGGGPGLAPTLIEVKSGNPRAEHASQLRHYALLGALRHGAPPAAAAIWYPGGDGPCMVSDVSMYEAVPSSARRVAGALSTLAELWEGRAPALTPGSHCSWCPEADHCEAAGASL